MSSVFLQQYRIASAHGVLDAREHGAEERLGGDVGEAGEECAALGSAAEEPFASGADVSRGQ